MIITFFVVLLLMIFICIAIAYVSAKNKSRTSRGTSVRESIKADTGDFLVLPVYVENIDNDLNSYVEPELEEPELARPPRSSSNIKETRRLEDINGYSIPIN